VHTSNDSNVKLLFVAAYEPYTNPPSYISIFSLKTPLLLVSCLHQEDMEAQAKKAIEKLELDENSARGTIANNLNSIWELGKFCELVAANSLKTAELLCTPSEFVRYTVPEWEKARSEISSSGVLSSIRLSRKCVEVAKKVLGGGDVENDATKYQIWRLATIVGTHLKNKEYIAFPGNPLPHSLSLLPSPPSPLALSLHFQSDTFLRRFEGVSTNTKL
jgi:hypothetical protein